MEALITYQKRLVEEKGLPPSRLMLEQAASATTASLPVQMPGRDEKDFKFELCDKCFKSMHGLKTHMGHKHKDLQKPEEVCDEETNIYLELAHKSEDRQELFIPQDNSSIVSIPEFLVPPGDFTKQEKVILKVEEFRGPSAKDLLCEECGRRSPYICAKLSTLPVKIFKCLLCGGCKKHSTHSQNTRCVGDCHCSTDCKGLGYKW